jgi:hypothetical protein
MVYSILVKAVPRWNGREKNNFTCMGVHGRNEGGHHSIVSGGVTMSRCYCVTMSGLTASTVKSITCPVYTILVYI